MEKMISNNRVSLFYIFILFLIFPTQSLAETDITDKILQNSTRMLFNRQTKENYFDVSLTNNSESVFLTPIIVVIDSISTDAVTVSNADGYTDDGKPYFKYVNIVNGINNEFNVSQATTNKKWSFSNPNRLRFTYATKIFGSKYISSLQHPNDLADILYDLGGEPFEIQIAAYSGKVNLGSTIDLTKYFVDSAIAGITALSNQGLFSVEMNTDATTLLRVVDENNKPVLYSIFPKALEIRDKNPIIDSKSTAVAIIALQAGVITGQPYLDAIILSIIKNIPETEILAQQIAEELSAGTFDLNEDFSDKIFNISLTALNRLSEIDLNSALNTNLFTKFQINLETLFANIVPNAYADYFEWGCTEEPTDYLFDLDTINGDGLCITTNQPPTVEYFTKLTVWNTEGRYTLVGIEEGDGLTHLGWVAPRKISLPTIEDIFEDLVKEVISTTWNAFINQIFDIEDDKKIDFLESLKNYVSKYFGKGYLEPTHYFDKPGQYSLKTVGAGIKGFIASEYKFEIMLSTFGSAVEQFIIPIASIVLDIKESSIINKNEFSIESSVCADRINSFFLTRQVAQGFVDISFKFEQEGLLPAMAEFSSSVLADKFLSEEGLLALTCLMKNFYSDGWGANRLRPKIVDKLKNIFTLTLLSQIKLIDKYIDGGNALSSTILFEKTLFTVDTEDTYSLVVSSQPPPAPSQLLSPLNNSTLSHSDSNSFTWLNSTSDDSIKYCLVINDRGGNLSSSEDDTNVYDSCNMANPEYQLVVGNILDLPAYTLLPDSHYTWAVYAVDDVNNLMSESSEWWNISTNPLNTVCSDNDGDGYVIGDGCGPEVDCDDNDYEIYPGAEEICDDGIDNNCDEQIDEGCGVSTVTSAGQVWMDHNLGASRVAMFWNDTEAYGDLYQWGRYTDGHEKRTSATTTTLSSSDTPGHGNFIIPPLSAPQDWRSPQNDNLWQGVSGINNPCPTGFRLPTAPELETERISWSSNNIDGAFDSPLKLVPSGWREGWGNVNAPVDGEGEDGFYWSSTVNGSSSYSLFFWSDDANVYVFQNPRALGLSVRCILDYEPEVPTVTSAGQVWMDRNLGASQVANSQTDPTAYGDLYQWGRDNDGHEKRDSETTSTLSSSDNPGHGNFILAPISPYDWRTPQNDNLWQGASGINNPCPPGFRLPTNTELETEMSSWTENNAAGAYKSPLKLVLAGNREMIQGNVQQAGSYGIYLSSSPSDSIYSSVLVFHSGGADMGSGYRAAGFSLRCLKD